MWWLKWLPWKFLVGRLAKSHGMLDPLTVLAHVRRFSQPSEVMEPIELVRGALVRHARGLMNSRAIQHNLDWVWPYWVTRQFDPYDDSFIPRAFSLTHINLTHRNWTAVGIPDFDAMPIVDPRGLVTPHFDGWSLDGCVMTQSGDRLFPSRQLKATQEYDVDGNLSVVTRTSEGGMLLVTEASVEIAEGRPVCRYKLKGVSSEPAWLVVSLRPYNPEGVSFIHKIDLDGRGRTWRVEDKVRVEFDTPVEQHGMSTYHDGDILLYLPEANGLRKIKCDVGMATAAALFEVKPDEEREVTVTVPIAEQGEKVSGRHQPAPLNGKPARERWEESLAGHARLQCPDPLFEDLYNQAVRSCILHAPGDVYPGPYTYKQFWFRDAAYILNALLCAGLHDRAAKVLELFPSRQTVFGYFSSQIGEWDSNGEALWTLDRYCQLTNQAPPEGWRDMIEKGANWIVRKRTSTDSGKPHAGLFPAGFSAEHLGPNDFYYWDDFWGIAGLHSAARMLQQLGDEEKAREFEEEAASFMQSVVDSLDHGVKRNGRPALPASPYRRLDSGAIGSVVVGYPLQLWPGDDERLLDTVEFLLDNCMVHGGFFQDMIHSGINPYLTLHMAQVLMRGGDKRFLELIQVVAELASPTGQWPEAVHSRTLGGCMGDGQHIWAASEWILMMRNLFVYEENHGDPRLVLGAGIPASWLEQDGVLRYGPAPTPWGPVTVEIETKDGGTEIRWEGNWFKEPAPVEIRLPGFEGVRPEPGETSARRERVRDTAGVSS